MKVLIVETDEGDKLALAEAFTRASFDVEEVCQRHNAYARMMSFMHDVIVLVSRWHSEEVLEACREYRRNGGWGVLLALGPGSVEWEENVINAGADCFVDLPCRSRDIVMRANLMMRASNKSCARRELLKCGDVSLDCRAGVVYKGTQPVHLFPMEFALLEFLLRHPNQSFSSAALYQRLWSGKSNGSNDTVRTHVKTLRRKIDSPGMASIIHTDNSGYKLVSSCPTLVRSEAEIPHSSFTAFSRVQYQHEEVSVFSNGFDEQDEHISAV